jgi:hypothetical protein
MSRIKNPACLGVAVFLVFFTTVLSPTLIQGQTLPRVKVNIVANGKVMTDQPITIFAGQAVTLSIKASIAGTVVYPTWQGSWTTVYAYPATVQSATVIPVSQAQLKQDTVKFYWIDQGPKQVTLLFYLQKGYCIEGPANCVGQGNVTAKFNVVGPTNVKVTPVTSGTVTTDIGGKVNVTGKVACFDGGKKVGLGDGKTNAGIAFSATATMPSGSSGTFGWTQLVNSDNFQFSGNNLPPANQSYSGLDVNPDTPTTYMYGLGDSVDDSPGMPLGSGTGYTKVSRQMTATLYLMWMGDSASDTIPVPLGAITWFTGWTVTFNPQSTDPSCKWTISGAYVRSYAYVPSVQYPRWTKASMPPTTMN